MAPGRHLPGRADRHVRQARQGKLQTRKWRKDGEDSDRFSTEILLVPGSRIQFLDKPANGNAAPTASSEATPPATAADPSDMDDSIPF